MEEKKEEGVVDTTVPETPTLNADAPSEAEETVVDDITNSLGDEGEKKEEETGDAPQARTPNMIDLNNLSQEQIQDLQEAISSTPRRVKKKDSYHTIELRQIEGKTIVEWGKTYFDLKRDETQRRDVMKTMIPVRFHGEDKFVDILWKDEFMLADRITCRVEKMDKEDKEEVVGTTLKRDKDGGQTLQEVEMYVNKVIITLTVTLPNGEQVTLDGSFAN